MRAVLSIVRRSLLLCLSLCRPRHSARRALGDGTPPAASLGAPQAAVGSTHPVAHHPLAPECLVDNMDAGLVPRAVAMQGASPAQPVSKRRKVEPPAAAAAFSPGRDAARREWGPPQFARVLPALYARDCSTAAQAAAIAGGEPLPAPPKRSQPPRPNHFLALQVSHAPGVVAAIQRVQAAVSKHSPHLKKACVEACTSHLTMGVMALHNEEDIARAEEAMGQLGAVLAPQGLLAPLDLELVGLSHFNGQVLYLDVGEGEGLQRLLATAAAVRAHFTDCGLLQDANRPFTPHVTIAKLSKLPRGGGKGGWRGEGRRGKGKERLGGGGKGRGRDWRGDYEAGQLEEAEAAAELEAAVEGEATVPLEMAAEAVGAAQAGDEEDVGAARVQDELLDEAGSGAGAEEAEGEAGPPQDRQHGKRGKQGRQRGGAEEQGGGGSGSSRGGIPPESYSALAGISGGAVQVTEVQLCKMMGRRLGEYYQVLATVRLTPAEEPPTGPAVERLSS